MIHRSILHVFVLIVVVVCTAKTAVAQSSEIDAIERLLIRQYYSGGEILSIEDDGLSTLIYSYPFDVEIAVEFDIVASPAGDQVAFTTMPGVDTPPQLYIVSLNPFRVDHYDIPDTASIEWSPSQDALLLKRPSIYIGGRIGESGEIYVFDIATETLTLITTLEDLTSRIDAMWSPNGESVIVVDIDFTGTGERVLPELSLVNRDGTNIQQITNLNELAQDPSFDEPLSRGACEINNLEWSADNERYYYTLVCNEGELVSLYSTNLEGDNRLEVDLIKAFPESFLTELGIPRLLSDLYIETGNSIYLVVESRNSYLHFVHLTAPQLAEIIYSAEPATYLFTAMSPDNTQIVYSTGIGDVNILNLQTRNVITRNFRTDEESTCRVQWLDNETVYVDLVSICGRLNQQFYTVRETIAWTPATNTVESVTGNVDSVFDFILPLPELPELPTGFNHSPTALAGPDIELFDTDGNGLEEVVLDGSGSSDVEGLLSEFEWYENGQLIATNAKATVTLPTGLHLLTLRVSDAQGLKDIDVVSITVVSP